MLDQREIEEMRSDLAEAMPDEIEIQRRTKVRDPGGGWSDTFTTVETVMGRLEQITGSEATRTGTIGVTAVVAAIVPAHTDVRATDRLLAHGRSFEVRGVGGSGAWELSRQVDLQEVSS